MADGLRRRDVLLSAAAATALAAAPAWAATEGQAAKAPFRVDFHHHILPPKWIEAARSHKPDNTWGPNLIGWTPAIAIEQMDRHRIAYAVTELGLPGVWWAPPDEAAALARQCNEYAAQMARDYPGRFGMFATIPLPHVDETLKEIAYAYDTLKADGIGFLTSYGTLWPGDQSFAPVWQELNRRKAVLHFHPTVANCCIGLIPDVMTAVEEYLFDTARAITSLLYSGTLSKYPDVRFIFSHAGGAFPPLSDRITGSAKRTEKIRARLPHGPDAELAKLYFDVATSVNPVTFGALRRWTTTDRIVLGTDHPYVAMDYTVDALDHTELSAKDRQRINTGNALALLPHLRERLSHAG
ncbi:MAG TPA: amidohydrolase family protein [Stellaceae bacterium]|nr:amidohydrolase family protein [Stellaceae bacterium]